MTTNDKSKRAGSAAPDVSDGPASQSASDLARVLDVTVELSVELGSRRMRVADVLALTPGSTVEFSKPADESLDIFVNDQLVARGEAVVLGERYGVRITEVVSPNERLRQSGVIREAVR